MRCPSCDAGKSSIRSAEATSHGITRTRECRGCRRTYRTIEIPRASFDRVVELLRARRDLDQLLLNQVQWGDEHHGRTTTHDKSST